MNYLQVVELRWQLGLMVILQQKAERKKHVATFRIVLGMFQQGIIKLFGESTYLVGDKHEFLVSACEIFLFEIWTSWQSKVRIDLDNLCQFIWVRVDELGMKLMNGQQELIQGFETIQTQQRHVLTLKRRFWIRIKLKLLNMNFEALTWAQRQQRSSNVIRDLIWWLSRTGPHSIRPANCSVRWGFCEIDGPNRSGTKSK